MRGRFLLALCLFAVPLVGAIGFTAVRWQFVRTLHAEVMAPGRAATGDSWATLATLCDVPGAPPYALLPDPDALDARVRRRPVEA